MIYPYCKKCPVADVKEEYAMVGSEWKCIKAYCTHEAACGYIAECAVNTPKAETRKAAPKKDPAPAPKKSKPKTVKPKA